MSELCAGPARPCALLAKKEHRRRCARARAHRSVPARGAGWHTGDGVCCRVVDANLGNVAPGLAHDFDRLLRRIFGQVFQHDGPEAAKYKNDGAAFS